MRISATYLLSALLLTACGESNEPESLEGPAAPESGAPESGTPGEGKRDAAQKVAGLVKSVELFAHEVVDGEKETFVLVAEVTDAFYDEVVDGEVLDAEMWLLDGDANPDFKIKATLTYDEDHVGAFISDELDASDFLPWSRMQVRLSGERGYDDFVFNAGDDKGAPVDPTTEAPRGIEVLGGMEMVDYSSEDGEKEVFRLVGYVDDPYYAAVNDSHVLSIKIWASDGASSPDFYIEDTLLYVEDGIGAYISNELDTSELLPWQQLTVEVWGELEGERVLQQFTFAPGEGFGLRVQPEAPAVEPVEAIREVEVVGLEIVDGEQASLRLVAEVAEAFYETVDDGHTLQVEIWAADGASNPDFRIPGELKYSAHGVGAYITDTIDVSDLLPWGALGVRVYGELNGAPVDQVFTLDAVETVD